MSTYRRLNEQIDSLQIALIWVGGFLVTAIGIIVSLLTAISGVDAKVEQELKDFVERQNQETLLQCQEEADECHIEFVYDRDGNLLGGNVVGQSRK